MHNKFSPSTIIVIDGAEYRFVGYRDGRIHLVHTITGAAYVHPDKDGVVGMLTDEEFDDLLESGRLEVRGDRTHDKVRLQNEASQYSIAQASELDKGIKKMLVQIEMLDDAGVQNGDKAIDRFLAKNWNEKLAKEYGKYDPPRTIRSWRRNRGRPGRRHPRDMIRLNRVKGLRRTPTDPNREIMWKHAVDGWTTKGRVGDFHSLYLAEITQVNEGRHPLFPQPETPYKSLSERTMRRAYDFLESSATADTKNGKQAVEQDWAGAGRSLTADFAFHRVIVDHTRLNLHVVDDEFEIVLGRPWLSLAIDVKTRAVVAWLITFIDPCNWTVGEIIKRMALPKRPPANMAARYPVLRKIRGKPTELIVDNAAEFRSHAMEAAARGAGFGVRFCPIKSPRYRAVGERLMKTVNDDICELLPGRTLSPHDARRFGLDSADEACVTMMEVEAVANMVVAMYNTTPHEGIGKRQPALLIEHELNRHGIVNFADLDSFLIDTMAIKDGVQLSPSGIRAFGGLRYHDIRAVRELLDDLVPLEARRKRRDDATAVVDFRYDPMDIGRIYVWNRRTRKFVVLACSDPEYSTGLPEWFHDKIRESARSQGHAFNTEEERKLARSRLIQAIRDLSLVDKKKARANAARLLEIPRIRQITGNIVELAQVEPEPVGLDEFISCDRAALTSLDQEILSSRPAVKPRPKHANLRGRRAEVADRDRRDAGAAAPSEAASKPVRRPRPKAERGGFA